MALESKSGLGTFNSYGARDVEQKFGAEIGDDVIKHVMFEVDASKGDVPVTGSERAVSALDYKIPKGSFIQSCRVVVETAFNTLTLLTVGTFKATDGTTAINASGLVSTALATVDAKGDVVVGAGAQVVTGTFATNAGGCLQEDAVIRVAGTGAAPTLGKARVYVTYLQPATLVSTWPS